MNILKYLIFVYILTWFLGVFLQWRIMVFPRKHQDLLGADVPKGMMDSSFEKSLRFFRFIFGLEFRRVGNSIFKIQCYFLMISIVIIVALFVVAVCYIAIHQNP